MEVKRPNLDRIAVPTRIIVHRSELSTTAIGEVIQRGEYVPSGGEVCELEAGGEIIARGKIVRKRGEYWFKVMQTEKEENT